MNVKFFMNTKLRHMTTIFALTFLATACACAQSARNNPAGLMFRDRVEPHWLADATGETNGFWYRVNLPENRREFILVNALAGRRVFVIGSGKLGNDVNDSAADLKTI